MDQTLALYGRQRRVFLGQQAGSEASHLLMKLIGLECAELCEIHPVDEHPVEARLHVLEALLIADGIVSEGQSVFSN